VKSQIVKEKLDRLIDEALHQHPVTDGINVADIGGRHYADLFLGVLLAAAIAWW
jgi:hypothetical protein